MPQLAKGGKWIFGWVIVRADRTVAVPPAAAQEYGFAPGDEVLLLRGSLASGGFGLSTRARLAGSALTDGLAQRTLGESQIDDGGRLRLPPGIDVTPGQRLLVGRGSGYALGFFTRGRIVAAAQQYDADASQPPIEAFE
ncbi:MAG: hypothetical protein JXJ20_03335 [Anaerolineae bacterium]|nr:hypothetical protein [Anaerolineae bacterium]